MFTLRICKRNNSKTLGSCKTKRDENFKCKGMINRLMTNKIKKKQRLRNNEYYSTQEIFDDLYFKSKFKYKYRFNKLIDIICCPENIKLAYRNIKKNKGSNTKGVNGRTIKNFANMSDDDVIEYVRRRLSNYHPQPVRRVEIPKDNGKTRPLGIPTIEDRLIQQCILQVLEPICEGKFYNHSYGFRPNRSTHHAISRCYTLANINKLHYVVDIDIKGFFDNVNHGKLIKQMWSLGIQDKQLLCIISKMLKAPVEGIGVTRKGTPQGGILSPLLSNIVLNELDWWIADQWDTFKTKREYNCNRDKMKMLRSTAKLKEIFIVRYADDFKIFCRDYETACKIFVATKQWLKERLYLDISEEKSKITNLKTTYSEYLGFKMKIRNKGKKQVIKSHISDKAKGKIKQKIRNQIITISKHAQAEEVNRYNSLILGLHNYYRVATHVNVDFANISHKTSKSLYNRTKGKASSKQIASKTYEKYYGKYNFKKVSIQGITLFPIAGIKTKPPINFSQDICNFTPEGRAKIHERQLSVSTETLRYLMENPIIGETIEYNDNRISLYVGQNGLCGVTKEPLQIGNMQCHHKTPRQLGGEDKYENLIFVKQEVHELIHATKEETIQKYKEILKLDKTQLKKVNNLRLKVGNAKV